MKKNIFFILICFYVNYVSSEITLGRHSTATAGTDWALEIKNKSKKPLYLKVTKENRLVGLDRNSAISNAYINIPQVTKSFDIEKKEEVFPAYKIAASKGNKESDHGYLRMAGLDPSQDYYIFIWEPEVAEKLPYFINRDIVKVKDTPMPQSNMYKYMYVIQSNPKRNKILLKWDNDKLLPQTGQLKGIKSSSQSGISTKDNITSKELSLQYKTK